MLLLMMFGNIFGLDSLVLCSFKSLIIFSTSDSAFVFNSFNPCTLDSLGLFATPHVLFVGCYSRAKVLDRGIT